MLTGGAMPEYLFRRTGGIVGLLERLVEDRAGGEGLPPTLETQRLTAHARPPPWRRHPGPRGRRTYEGHLPPAATLQPRLHRQGVRRRPARAGTRRCRGNGSDRAATPPTCRARLANAAPGHDRGESSIAPGRHPCEGLLFAFARRCDVNARRVWRSQRSARSALADGGPT